MGLMCWCGVVRVRVLESQWCRGGDGGGVGESVRSDTADGRSQDVYGSVNQRIVAHNRCVTAIMEVHFIFCGAGARPSEWVGGGST